MNKVDVMSKKLDDLGTKYKGLNFLGKNESNNNFTSQKSLNPNDRSSRFSRSNAQVKSNA